MTAKFASIYRSAAIAVLLSGCTTAITFEAQTIVDEEAAVTRTTWWSGSGKSSLEELQTQYDLPPSGRWMERVENRDASTADTEAPDRFYNHVYTIFRERAPQAAITGDFARRGAGQNAAINRISVTMNRRWLWTNYEYRESFHDIVTFESVASAARAITTIALRIIAEEAANLPGADFTVEEANDRLTARADEILAGFLAVVRENCFVTGATMESCEKAMEQHAASIEFETAFDDDEILLKELTLALPVPAAVPIGDWYRTLERELLERIDEREEFQDDRLFVLYTDQIFGAHGFTLFETYPFELSVLLPGGYVSTNADGLAGAMLTWSFDHETFWLTPKSLHARSRIVHPARGLFFLILFVALIGIVGSFRHGAGVNHAEL